MPDNICVEIVTAIVAIIALWLSIAAFVKSSKKEKIRKDQQEWELKGFYREVTSILGKAKIRIEDTEDDFKSYQGPSQDELGNYHHPTFNNKEYFNRLQKELGEIWELYKKKLSIDGYTSDDTLEGMRVFVVEISELFSIFETTDINHAFSLLTKCHKTLYEKKDVQNIEKLYKVAVSKSK